MIIFCSLGDDSDRQLNHPTTLTMAKEGPWSTERIAFCNWYGRALHEYMLHLWGRASVDFKVHIDPNAVLAATSVEIDGQRVHLDEWDLGPDRLGDDGSPRVKNRQEVNSRWEMTTRRNKMFHTHFVKNEEISSSGGFPLPIYYPIV